MLRNYEGQQKSMAQIQFEKHDKDKSGTIDASEFQALCYDLGHYMKDEDAHIAVGDIDKDNDNQINFEEFFAEPWQVLVAVSISNLF